MREHHIDLVARKSWCESNDPEVVGLYVDPPAKAIVLCVDEKPSIQALQPAQGYLKLPSGRALQAARHHDLVCRARGRHRKDHCIAFEATRRVEFLGFMNSVVTAFPDNELHVILHNLNTHTRRPNAGSRTPNVRFHFPPTRSSWLNQVETWFAILQRRSLNGASFTVVEQSQQHIDAFTTAYNETAEPFAWTEKKVYQRRFKTRRITQL
jgi:transposase